MVQKYGHMILRFVTIHTFDRRTDRETDRWTDIILIVRPRLHSMQRGKNDQNFSMSL